VALWEYLLALESRWALRMTCVDSNADGLFDGQDTAWMPIVHASVDALSWSSTPWDVLMLVWTHTDPLTYDSYALTHFRGDTVVLVADEGSTFVGSTTLRRMLRCKKWERIVYEPLPGLAPTNRPAEHWLYRPYVAVYRRVPDRQHKPRRPRHNGPGAAAHCSVAARAARSDLAFVKPTKFREPSRHGLHGR
jgi:hypothetical protein